MFFHRLLVIYVGFQSVFNPHGSGATRGALKRYPGRMTNQGQHDHVPTWSGDAAEFESYVTACKWYAKSTKESERGLVVARLWGRLTGAAKSVVRHLDPDAYDWTEGLKNFLQVLRESPLQQLPIPDSFSRLEKWNQLRRFDRETISELLVREEELFTDLQQALTRARTDQKKTAAGTTGAAAAPVEPSVDAPRNPPSTPSRSPTGARQQESPPMSPPETSPGSFEPPQLDFFADELRGYRLLKASRLTAHERQNVLVQTANSTHFVAVRRALRTLFSEDTGDRSSKQHGQGRVWWQEAEGWEDVNHDEAYWAEWSPSSYGSFSEDGYAEQYWSDWHGTDWWSPEWDGAEQYETEWADDDDVQPDEAADGPEESQLREAYNIAGEANKTLREAREAVKRVRQARGYYAPESASGKGLTFAAKGKSSYGKSSKGKGKSSRAYGPCFICGKDGHGYQQCPDRFQKGSKGYLKGASSKGKSKGKPGKVNFYDIHLNIFAADWDETTSCERKPTWALLDTGATENAVGSDTLSEMISKAGFSYQVTTDDRPTFRFGNGLKDRALSRVDLHGTSLGNLAFYVLGGSGRKTPPLIGARTLRSKNALMSYGEGLFMYSNVSTCGRPCSVKLNPMKSGHMAIDLTEDPAKLDIDLPGQSTSQTSNLVELVSEPRVESACAIWRVEVEREELIEPNFHENMIYTVEAEVDVHLAERLQVLAHQLRDLRSRSASAFNERCALNPSCSSWRRSSSDRMALYGSPPGGPNEAEPVRQLDDLQEMRPPDDVQDQGITDRNQQTNGTGHACDSTGNGRASADVSNGAMHGEDHERQVDGSERKVVANGHRLHDGGEHDLDGVPGEDRKGDSSCQVLLGSKQPATFDASCNNGGTFKYKPDVGSSGGVASRECRAEGPTQACRGNSGGNDKLCDSKGENGEEGAQGHLEDQAGDGIRVSNLTTGDLSSHQRRGGHGRDQSEVKAEPTGLKTLWNSLADLRNRMRSACGHTSTTSCPPQYPDSTTNTTSQVFGLDGTFGATSLKSSMALAGTGGTTRSPMSTSLRSPSALACTGETMSLRSPSALASTGNTMRTPSTSCPRRSTSPSCTTNPSLKSSMASSFWTAMAKTSKGCNCASSDNVINEHYGIIPEEAYGTWLGRGV